MINSYLNDLFSLAGQTAVVIGGTGVLGGALCDGLAQAGAHVIVAGREPDRGAERVVAIQKLAGEAQYLEVDVAERESLEALLAAVPRCLGRAARASLWNCAGVNSASAYRRKSPMTNGIA